MNEIMVQSSDRKLSIDSKAKVMIIMEWKFEKLDSKAVSQVIFRFRKVNKHFFVQYIYFSGIFIASISVWVGEIF